MGTFLLSLLLIVGIFLMLVILIQRGRGGGLAGAFGGLGGQSAFGTKAGDVFTVITVVTAVVWVILACVTGWQLRKEALPSSFFSGDGAVADKVEAAPAEKVNAEPVDKAPASNDEPVGGAEANGAAKEEGQPEVPAEQKPE